MNDHEPAGFDPRIADWLESDPDAAPDEALRVVLAALPSIGQRRGLTARWRSPLMQIPRLALGAVAVVAIVAGGLFFLRPTSTPGVGGGASPSPSATASGAASPDPSASGLGAAPTIIAVTATDTDCTGDPGPLTLAPLTPGTSAWITVTNDSARSVFFQIDRADDGSEYEQFRAYMQAEHDRAAGGQALLGPADFVDLGADRLVAAGESDRFLAPTLAGTYAVACLPEEANTVVDAFLVGPLTVGP